MTREEAKELLPVIQAFVEGKTIQDWTNDTWKDKEYTSFGELSQSSIKPQPKYRPFKSQEECRNEMLKHQPFGYIKRKENNEITQITGMNTVHYGELHIDLSFNSNSFYTADNLFDVYTFTDGTPFGIKEE